MGDFNPDYDDSPRKAKTDVPEPPTLCTSDNCYPKQRRASLLLIEVQAQNGQNRIVTASQAMPQAKTSPKRALRSDVSFVRWHARCDRCFFDDPPSVSTDWAGG